MDGTAFTKLDIPILETERLKLRGHTIDDFAQSAALWADHEVTKFIGGKPLTTEETWSRFLRYAGHWSVLGFGFWVIEEKESGHFVGEAGFLDYKREMEPPFGDGVEAGWALAPSKHGKGYATEAATALLAWGREHFGNRQIACIIHPDHAASIRVAVKCGFRESHIATYKGGPTTIFKLIMAIIPARQV
jgi:RimJ/RimL family protein N-acetyltransferase